MKHEEKIFHEEATVAGRLVITTYTGPTGVMYNIDLHEPGVKKPTNLAMGLNSAFEAHLYTSGFGLGLDRAPTTKAEVTPTEGFPIAVEVASVHPSRYAPEQEVVVFRTKPFEIEVTFDCRFKDGRIVRPWSKTHATPERIAFLENLYARWKEAQA